MQDKDKKQQTGRTLNYSQTIEEIFWMMLLIV